MNGSTKLPELYFLGARNYVQALTQLKYAAIRIGLRHRLDGAYGMFIHRYKQVEETDSKLEIFTFESDSIRGPTRATLDIRVGYRPLKYKLVGILEDLERVPDKVYSQKRYVEHSATEVSTTVEAGLDFWDILEEAVQLTKVFHMAKYNSVQRKFRFVVGGFESLLCRRMVKNEPTEIRCRILRHAKNPGGIYNYISIGLRDAEGELSFRIPFIGIPKDGAPA